MVALALLVCATVVWGATYSVKPTDNWAAYKNSLQPGDTLTFNPSAPGQATTYTLSGSNSWTINGALTQPIIVQGAPGEKIILLMDACQNIIELKGSYFVFQNFEMTATANGAGGIGLRLQPDTKHVIVNNCIIHDVTENAFSANSHTATYDNVTFSNNEAYHTGDTGECFYVGCQGTGDNGCQFMNGALINNYCHDTCYPNPCTGGSMGSGYQVKGWTSHSNVVRNNVCENVATVCVLLYDDYDLGVNIVEGNILYGGGDSGIQVSAGAIIRNNIIYGNNYGITVSPNSANLQPGSSNRNIQIIGNTLINNQGNGLKIPALTGTGSRVVNNVIIEDSGTAFPNTGSQSGVTWSNNAYYGGSSPVAGQISVGASGSGTLFVNAAASNFHPKAGSPLLAAGAALKSGDSTIDISCVTRNSAKPTIGAYETSDGPAFALTFKPPCGGNAPSPTANPTNMPTPKPTTPKPTQPAETLTPTAPPTPKPTGMPTAAPTLACSTVNCGAHGTCTEPNPVCVCTDSYTGSRCETAPVDKCVGNPPAVNCGSHGTCAAGVCTCRDGYTDSLCATPPAPTCTDGVKNSDEDGIDCGGTIAKCPACPTYYWAPNAWTDCSAPCGGGTHTRVVDCLDASTKMIVTPDKCTATAPHDFTTQEVCNPDPCATYSWRSGTYGDCSAQCGTGSATRAVDCISSAGNVVVSSSMCNGTKPDTSMSCNTQACVAPHWVTGTWSDCSLPCGGGTQTRTKGCFDASNQPSADNTCPLPVPDISQPCNTDACVNYNWKACPTFYPCTAQCNGGGAMVGNQYRDVFCIKDTDGSPVDLSLCNNATRPTTLLSICNTQPCSNYNWMADANFGPCTLQASGLWQRFRTFHCHAADGALALRQSCVDNAGKLPIAVLPCTPGTCASPDGCPVVEIGDVFNQCDSRLVSSCDFSSECGAAANLLDSQMKSLGFAANPVTAVKCVTDYIASLPASDRPATDLLTYVESRLTAGSAICDGFGVSGAVGVAPSTLVAIILVVKLFYGDY